MALSSELISQFVKITNDKTEVKEETTVYGTIVEHNGSKYVRLDGSDILTPIEGSTTADVKADERVTVLIKNHIATVTGNISSPAARVDDVSIFGDTLDNVGAKITEFEIVLADKVSTKDLDSERARINALQAENVLINQKLSAQEADISELEAENVTISEKLTANEAEVETLKTTKLDATVADAIYATIENLEATDANIHDLESTYASFASTTTTKLDALDAAIKDLDAEQITTESLEARFANIDFSNIGEAAIEKFFSASGLIENVVVGEGTVTGKLVGVTISGDLIEGNTVVAEKLIIKGTDGLYYKLNTDGVTTASEQTDYNSLNGSIIKAKSVTADKISVTDLVAFGATIGGFKITNNALYSGTKSTVANTTTGVYMDSTGQMAIGDADNFLRYYKDSNGNYKLEIAADSISLGASQDDLETTINEVITSVDNIEIGGRNLLLNSATKEIVPYGDTEAYRDYGGEVSEWNATETFRIYGVGGSNVIFGTLGDSSRLGIASESQYYATSIYVRNNSESDEVIVSANHLVGNPQVALAPLESKRVELVGLGNGWGYIQLNFKVPIEGDMFDVTYWHPKFELGNKATDWTPAPEDIDEDIDAAQATADNAQSTATSNETRITEAETLLEVLSESISMLVTDGSGASLMTQTESGWTFSTAEIQDIINRTSEALNDLTSDVGDVNNTVDILRQAVDDLGAIAEYVKIGTYEDEPCIELGESDSDFKLRITNTRMIFTEGTAVLAYFNNQSLHIKKAVVEEELQQGGFVWRARSNGNLGLVWKGVAS